MPSPQDWLIVDVRGLKCPLPVLKTQKRMAPLPQGTLVAVLASDPMARIDIPHFCNEHGHSLIAQSEEEGFVRYEIRKGGGRPG
ncbi:sulfurtransferase TusA family protein [Afifella pfennigii]|uniref:sulfurtransferase TusA family protein n=1 Tax=Afifella pfennigii TaxID=209897 RepID=UPI00047B8629|nr:sulfurtransferase TusA family protein [Afifella pfennigii]